ncbi:MAG: cysteine--tRNA ligase [Gammaproteobacteria bacterium]
MDGIYLHNTLSGRRELFAPQNPRRATMYVCGPTVYGPAHVGNARPAAVFDLMFRLLRRRFGENAVVYARNITDIDDKIIAAAAEGGEPAIVVARRWRDVYRQDMRALAVLPPTTEPHATDYVPQIIAMIETLLQKGNAYFAENHVLFYVPSFSDYGALSNRRTEDMLAGARVEVAPYKKNAADFVLWKPSADDAPGWESPWGRGRPGWHIECSAMAAECLGEEIDLHGGGQDLIFPHHENEIAQSRCAHGCAALAKFWMHNGHVTMDGGKMSKSLGNVRLLCDALAQFPGEAVRYALLSAHYRRPLHWGGQLLEDAKAALDRLYRALGESSGENNGGEDGEITAALCDDLNTPKAFALLHEFAGGANKGNAAQRKKLFTGGKLMGFFNVSTEQWFQHAGAKTSGAQFSEEQIAALVEERRLARLAGDFAAADAARDKLAAGGVALEDSAAGTVWRRK